jgi:ubiquinone biosynthesis monooxygenase Coq7
MRQLPSDLSHQEIIRRMIRVNHAGEYGAQRIYAGQLAVLGKSKAGPLIRHMAEQEQHHLDVFSKFMRERHVRPTVFTPLWHVAGYALGAATAMMGEKAAMACTVAVESVIDAHYAQQELELENREPELKAAITEFRAEEKEHHDTALEYGAEQFSGYEILTSVIAAKTKLAIWLSTRL